MSLHRVTKVINTAGFYFEFWTIIFNQFSKMKPKLFSILLLFLWSSCQEKGMLIKPNLRPLTESVYASARVQPKAQYQVYAGANGLLETIFVEEGQLVKKGQKLAQIVNLNPQINTENARLNQQLAKENYEGSAAILTGIMDEIQAAQLKLTTDSLNFERQQRLWKKQIGSKLEYDTRKLTYELSINTLQSLKTKYERTKKELATKVQLAENQLKSSQVSNDDFIIRAKMDGKVYDLFKEGGEAISMQEPIAIIGHPTEFIIEMEVDEMDITSIKEKQKILLNLDAYEGDVFEAILTKIYPQKELRTQTFKIEGQFNNPPTILYPGLSGEANIIIAEISEVLTIPREYLVDQNKVKLADGDLIKIEIGRKNMEAIEIISGIDTSTLIRKPE